MLQAIPEQNGNEWQRHPVSCHPARELRSRSDPQLGWLDTSTQQTWLVRGTYIASTAGQSTRLDSTWLDRELVYTWHQARPELVQETTVICVYNMVHRNYYDEISPGFPTHKSKTRLSFTGGRGTVRFIPGQVMTYFATQRNRGAMANWITRRRFEWTPKWMSRTLSMTHVVSTCRMFAHTCDIELLTTAVSDHFTLRCIWWL